MSSLLPPPNHSDTSRIYLDDELDRFSNALIDDLKQNPHITHSYGIFLLFKLGVRIGELVALSKSDINFNAKEIHVHKTETQIMDKESGKMVTIVVEYTKKKSPYGNRYIPLSDYDISILEDVIEINDQYGYKDEDFLFVSEKGRTTVRRIDSRIRKFCNISNFEEKSAHDIRRTVASKMNSEKAELLIIRDFLGHSDVNTTRGYIYDSNSKDKKNKIITDSLSTFNGLIRTQSITQKKALKTF